MEGRGQGTLSPASRAASPGARLAGRLLAGALAGGLLAAAAGFALSLLGAPLGQPEAAPRFRGYLGAGGWIAFPFWGAALGALFTARDAGTARQRALALALGVALLGVPILYRPPVPVQPPGRLPATREAKERAIRRWSFSSREDVRRIVTLSRDPDPWVREEAVMALGVNLVVSGAERGTSPASPSPARDPVLEELRGRLLEALESDPGADVRAEAAHALWRSPAAFGRVPEAAETLAKALDDDQVRTRRSLMLALDAAAGSPDSALKAAAARLAERTGDAGLRQAALRAAARERPVP